MKRIEVEAWPCGRRSGKKGKSVEQQAMDVVTEERERAKACRLCMGVEIVLPPWGSEVVSALTNPEILVCTFGYLFLPALCRRTGLIDTSKGAYRRAMVSYNVLMAVYSFGCFLLTGVSLGWDRGHGQWIRDLTGDKPTTLFTNQASAGGGYASRALIPSLPADLDLCTLRQCPSPLMENKIFMWVAWSFYYRCVWLLVARCRRVGGVEVDVGGVEVDVGGDEVCNAGVRWVWAGVSWMWAAPRSLPSPIPPESDPSHPSLAASTLSTWIPCGSC